MDISLQLTEQCHSKSSASGDTPSHGYLRFIINPAFSSLVLFKFNFIAYSSSAFCSSWMPQSQAALLTFSLVKIILKMNLGSTCSLRFITEPKFDAVSRFLRSVNQESLVLWPRVFSSIFRAVCKSVFKIFSINYVFLLSLI